MRVPFPIAILFALAGVLSLIAMVVQTIKAEAQPAVEPRREFAAVVADSELSSSERLRLVVIRHPLGKHFDMRCLLYTARESGGAVAQLVCPNATQEQLEDVSR